SLDSWFTLRAGAPRGVTGARNVNESELLQKSQVVGPELANIVDGVGQHGHALGPHAEGEAGVHGRVVAAVAEHHGVHHARAGDLEPAGPLGEPVGVGVVLGPVDV